MVDCGPAPVRPRVFVPEEATALLLEDVVRERIDDRPCGLVELVGPLGAGKSAAITHLAHVFRDEPRLRVADRPELRDCQWLVDQTFDRLVVWASPPPQVLDEDSYSCGKPYNFEDWRLASWSQDEWIEYLLAVHRERCASVMRRVNADPQRRWLAGMPGLCRVALDRMAADESLCDVRSAVRQELNALLPTANRRLAQECAFIVLNNASAHFTTVQAVLDRETFDSRVWPLLGYAPVNLLLAAEYLVEQLRGDPAAGVLEHQLPEPLVREAALLVRGDESLLVFLREIADGGDRRCHAMAASLLHAADVGWVPADGARGSLNGAWLAGAKWPGTRLSDVQLNKADLTGADLSDANWRAVYAVGAKMSGVRLHGAQLTNLRAAHARLDGADLSFVRASNADFDHADLSGANLEGSLMDYGKFAHADLRGAVCRRACLGNALFKNSHLDGADFCGADLSWADFTGVVLRVADFKGANFNHASLIECDLEYMSLPGANFEGAMLSGAHLTGSRMPAAKFRHADLALTGLADIDWPQADLRDADLRGATFHMGSSRSGLVGSPIASEGSRTGFYTDEYHEQEFKSPEEIRKANLCGADLRGARIDNVDFYLVDLRGARYTSHQGACFRASGAILEARV